jgi:hypothetical protein
MAEYVLVSDKLIAENIDFTRAWLSVGRRETLILFFQVATLRKRYIWLFIYRIYKFFKSLLKFTISLYQTWNNS